MRPARPPCAARSFHASAQTVGDWRPVALLAFLRWKIRLRHEQPVVPRRHRDPEDEARLLDADGAQHREIARRFLLDLGEPILQAPAQGLEPEAGRALRIVAAL